MDQKALFPFSYGVYIIAAQEKNNFSGCIINTATQITAEEYPKLIVAINKEHYTHQLIHKAKKANISVLSQNAPFELIGRFGFRNGREYNKLKNSEYKIGKNQMPIITEHAVSYIECDVLEEIDCNTHTIFILEMKEGEKLIEEPAMTYEYYHTVLKGFTPKKASTYNEEKNKK